MKYVYLLLCVAFCLTDLVAQSSVGGPRKWNHILSNLELKNQKSESLDISDPQAIQNLYVNFGGSPFLFSGKMNGSLVSKDGDLIENLTLMYDLFRNELFYIEDGREHVLKKHLIDQMIIHKDGEDRIFKRANPNLPDRFFEVLYEDKDLSFYKVHKVNKKDGHDNGMSRSSPKFLKATAYFMTNKKKRKSAHSLNLKKKNIYKYLPSKRTKACKKYVSEQKKFKLKSVESYVAMLSATKSYRTPKT